MAVDNTKIMIGPAIVSVGTYAASGAASGDLVDVGHTREPVEISFEFENADLESERAQGLIDTKPIRQGMQVTVPMLEVTPERARWALGQAAGNLAAGVLRFGDRAKQFHQVTILQSEEVADPYTQLLVTIWKAQIASIQPMRMAKADWTVLSVTFRVIRDDSVSTADKYCKFAWS